MPYNNESFSFNIPKSNNKSIFFHSFARKKIPFPHFERFLWSPKRKPKAIFLFSYTHLQKTRKWGVNIDKYTYYLRHWIAIVRNVGRCSCSSGGYEFKCSSERCFVYCLTQQSSIFISRKYFKIDCANYVWRGTVFCIITFGLSMTKLNLFYDIITKMALFKFNMTDFLLFFGLFCHTICATIAPFS